MFVFQTDGTNVHSFVGTHSKVNFHGDGITSLPRYNILTYTQRNRKYIAQVWHCHSMYPWAHSPIHF